MSSRSQGPRKPRPAPASAPQRQRRAFTTVQRGRTESGGDREAADALTAALMAPQQDRELAESVTHPVHAYPARMHPATARALLHLAGAAGTVLDPFCGAGTTLVEARFAGMTAFGVDINPLAVAISRAKTWTVARRRRVELVEAGREISAEAWREGKAARRAGYVAPAERKIGHEPSARNKYVGQWFAPHVRRELEGLLARIDEVAEDDAELAGPLRVALSAILYKVSKRASETDKSLVVKTIARGAAARLFGERVEMLCAGLDDLAAASSAPIPTVVQGDARKLGELGIPPGSVDVVVTSSPYAGTYDYAGQHELRMRFFGIDPRTALAGEIGARAQFAGSTPRGEAYVDWQRDLGQAVRAAATTLKPGGLFLLVIGDSLASGRAVRADDTVRVAASGVLEPVAWAWQERPKLGGLERQAFGTDPKREHIIMLRRPAGRRHSSTT